MPCDKYEALVTEWLIRERARYAPSAQVAALLFNINRKSGSRPHKPDDYMPPDPLNLTPQTENKSTGILRAIIAAEYKAWKSKPQNG